MNIEFKETEIVISLNPQKEREVHIFKNIIEGANIFYNTHSFKDHFLKEIKYTENISQSFKDNKWKYPEFENEKW